MHFNLNSLFALVMLLFTLGCGTTSDNDDDDDALDVGNANIGAYDGDDEWYDSTSNLTWKVNPAPNEMTGWTAKDYCSGLGSGWRLPSISELRSLIRGCSATQTGGSCRVADDCVEYLYCRDQPCDGCGINKGPSNGCYWPSEIKGNCNMWYWSSSCSVRNNNDAWYVYFYVGNMGIYGQTIKVNVRCVRSGK